ncbi:putative isoaspartyl peptidase/L-asparaginase [Pseudolycoriella hygida]|uniref:Isoaspartyl peptidase/L-asparaginase n=1 Tax=Pseudolycoriella hygida TaxID=35572 RepID=A0A9Q0RYC9_9DIPT|nr:putative isoaspartyl peptidase/L-asparaginase [Pseudolycoriella hygida]
MNVLEEYIVTRFVKHLSRFHPLLSITIEENLINGESVDNFVNKCGHVYHSKCILPWWDSTPEPTCPQCREPCNIDTITKIFLTVDHSPEFDDANRPTTIAIGDPKMDTLLRQMKEHIDVQTYNQSKDINDKFRQQNSDFSTLLLNNITRLKSNYDDKLSSVSRELTTAISSEHKRLLTALDSHDRTDLEGFNVADEHSPTKRRQKFKHPIAAVTCFIALVCLIVVIIYSHLILNALHTNEHFGSLNINNISQRLDSLTQELHDIASNVSRDNKNVKVALDNIGRSTSNGIKTQEILNRLGEVVRRGDQLLLEQIQTDRRINLKLEVLDNDISILKTLLKSEKTLDSNPKITEKQNQLEEQNHRLEAKLQHLQTILNNSPNAKPEELRKEIENDSELTPEKEDPKSIREEAVDLWNRLIHSDNSKSSGRVHSLNICYIVASIFEFIYKESNNSADQIEPVVIVHGGAGVTPDSRDIANYLGTKLAARIGYDKLLSGGSVLDAVEEAVRSMELDENFNAGLGSVLNVDGIASMEASIMSGNNLNAGCVTMVEDILHPISLARRVMENTNHTFLGGDGAMSLAKEQGIEILTPKGQLVTQRAKDALEAFKNCKAKGLCTLDAKTEIGHGGVGTVGAVAIDANGNIAVATSTGGMTGKIVGRIGDTPLIGCGTYADNNCGGVSTTGHGETIMRYNVAQKILQRIEYLAGAITIDASGNVGVYFTTKKMAWAFRKGNQLHYGIRSGDDFIEPA